MIIVENFSNKNDTGNNNNDNHEEIVQELMAKSGLSKQICTDIVEIFLCFSFNDRNSAYSKIESQLIPHLKETQDIGNIGIAFGMLIDEKALTQEEATNYSSKVIENLITNE